MRKLAKRLVDPELAAGLVCPDHYSGPDWIYTDGPAVAEVNAKAGFEPDPQQELGLDLIFAVNELWLPAAFSFCVVCCRQNLKTGLLKQAAVGWLAVTEEQKVVWSSHELLTTIEAQVELHELLKASPALSRLLPAQKNRGKYDDNLNKRIELTSGQKVLFKARTDSGGRGLAGDKVVLDEALYLEPSHTASLLPTMVARPTGQVLYASSPGLLKSKVLRDVRDRGRAGSTPRMFYLEWGGHWRECADPDCTHPKDARTRGIDCAADDLELRAKNNPTITTGRITQERIEDMRQELLPEDFIRECMGLWDDEVIATGTPVFDLAAWRKLGDAKLSERPPRCVVVLDSEPDGTAGSIGLAGSLGDGRVALVSRAKTGIAWMVEALKKIRGEVGEDNLLEVALHPSNPVGALVPALSKAGFEVAKLVHNDLARGCTGIQLAVDVEKRVVHAQQAEVTTAVAAARAKVNLTGEVWDRGEDRLPISPVVSLATALYRWDLLDSAEEQAPPARPAPLESATRPDYADLRVDDAAHMAW